MKSLAIALLALASATAAWAEEDEPATSPAAATEEAAQPAPEEKMICRSEKITGTRSKVRRTCHTRAEWDAIAEATRKTMDFFYRESNSTAPSISDGAGSGPKIPD
jgi:hypothetical protein